MTHIPKTAFETKVAQTLLSVPIFTALKNGTDKSVCATLLILIAALLCANALPAATPPPPEKTHTTNNPLPAGVTLSDPLPGPSDANVLWYKRPAATWFEALPIGNGSFGAMVFGGITNEAIQYNHDTIWSHPTFGVLGNVDARLPDARPYINKMRELIFAGHPAEADKIYRENISVPGYAIGAYQPMATLRMKFEYDLAGSNNTVRAYQHRLAMDTGEVSTIYTIGGTTYLREVFVAPGRNLMVCRIQAFNGGKINASLSLERLGVAKTSSEGTNKIVLSGAASDMNGKNEGTRFVTKVMARAYDGSVSSENGVLTIKDATGVDILITGATDFEPKAPFVRRKADLGAECDAQMIINSQGDAVGELKLAAAEWLSEKFNRVKIGINNIITDKNGCLIAPDKNTDTRERISNAGKTPDTLLTLQMYQYARYLLICSSSSPSQGRSLPATLQGIWSDLMTPAWDSDYHFNINVQMNYTFAPQANLLDTMPPFLDFLDTARASGGKVTREMFGTRGFLINLNTSGYATMLPRGRNPYMIWLLGAPWSASILMDYVRFSGDTDYLRREGFSVLEDSALFMLDWLVPDPKTGKLVAGPDVSPENSYTGPDGKRASVDMGCAMDQQIAHQLFSDYLEAAALLHHTSPVVDEVRAALTKLAPTQLTHDGRICEWSQDFPEVEAGHRHMSPLYAFYPGNQFTPDNAPDMIAAARKTVEWRKSHPGGAGKYGWSRMWIGSLYARFHQGNDALGMLEGLVANELFPNMMSRYSAGVFQIDANFGYGAVMNEMLLQSHAGYVELLPALPTEWKSGKVSGMLARGGYEMSFEWANGALVSCSAKSKNAGTLKLKYKDQIVSVEMAAGEEKSLESLFKIN